MITRGLFPHENKVWLLCSHFLNTANIGCKSVGKCGKGAAIISTPLIELSLPKNLIDFFGCSNKCKTHEQVTKYMVYELGGCYCRNCEYYFKEKFRRCPCCNVQVRYSTRSNRRRLESEVARI